MSEQHTETHIAIGMVLADVVFRKRGNHSEIHIGKCELAALFALAAKKHNEQLISDLAEALAIIAKLKGNP